jgi:hypothetical protein
MTDPMLVSARDATTGTLQPLPAQIDAVADKAAAAAPAAHAGRGAARRDAGLQLPAGRGELRRVVSSTCRAA